MKGFAWLRLLAIATAAVILASCRSLTTPLSATATAVTVLPEDVLPEAGAATDTDPLAGSLAAALAGDQPDSARPVIPAAVAPDPDAIGITAATATAPASLRRHEGVVPVGLEAPSPPLPRLACRDCPPAGRGPAWPGRLGPGACPTGSCRSGRCQPLACPTGSCPTDFCQPVACLPYERAVPVIRPCLVCDGGDHGAVAKAVGPDGLANLTAGDTVARYRPADDGPESDRVWIAESNCACVYAPRFAAVREVVRPLEDAAPVGPGGLV
jgi:hypothetical protein